MKNVKGYYTNYERNHSKIKKAIADIVREDEVLSVKNIAKRAEIGMSTAYEHGCKKMISRLLSADKEEADSILKEIDSVTKDELQRWTNELCKRYKLPECEVMVYVGMDDYVGIFGENDGGCMVVYEEVNHDRFCIAVKKDVLKDRQFVRDTLQTHLWNYKKFIEEE